MQVRDRWSEFERYGVSALVISFASQELLESYKEYLSLPFPIAADTDRTAYRRYGLQRGSFLDVWGPRTLWTYVRLLARGRKLQRPKADQDLSQLGGDFVLDAEGTLLFAHASTDPSDRPSVDELLASLREARTPPEEGDSSGSAKPGDEALRASSAPGVSAFTRELVADLRADGGSWSGWRRFLSRSLERSREQMREAPRTVRSILWWMAITAVLDAALLGTAFGVGALPAVAVTAALHVVWLFGLVLYLVLHVGLVRSLHPRGEGESFPRFGVPNGLSAMRLGLSPLAAYPLLDLAAAPAWVRYVSLATLVAMALSDAVDGFWARAFDVRSDLGRTLDPMADLVWISALAAGLYRQDVLPLWVLALIIVRFPGALAGALMLYLWRGPVAIASTFYGKVTTVATLALLLAGAAGVLLSTEFVGFVQGPMLSGAMVALGILLALGTLDLGLRALRWPR